MASSQGFGVDGWAKTPVSRHRIGDKDLEIAELPSKLAKQGLGRYITMLGNRGSIQTDGQVQRALLSSLHSEHVEWFSGIFEAQTRLIQALTTEKGTGELPLKFSVDEVWPGSSNLGKQIEWLFLCFHLSFTDFLVEAFGGVKEGTKPPEDQKNKSP